jgi:hypothetical protein
MGLDAEYRPMVSRNASAPSARARSARPAVSPLGR